MPYTITGCDSAGERHDYLMDDSGTITGDALLTGWLAENPLPARAGETPTDTELDEVRQHVSKLLTVVQMAAVPPEAPPAEEPEVDPIARRAPPAPPTASRHAAHHTTAELEAMTVTDLRSLAAAAQIAGASSMSKAELVTALSTPRSGSER